MQKMEDISNDVQFKCSICYEDLDEDNKVSVLEKYS